MAGQGDGVSGAVEKSRPQNEQVWQELSLPGCLEEQMRHTSESLLSLHCAPPTAGIVYRASFVMQAAVKPDQYADADAECDRQNDPEAVRS